MRVALPLVCLFLALAWFFTYAGRFMRACEMIGLVIFGIYHLFRVYASTLDLMTGTINVYVFWSTIYYIYIFLVLDRLKALAFSLAIFLATILIGIPHFENVRASDILVQSYISIFIYILVLLFFQRAAPAYLESDIQAVRFAENLRAVIENHPFRHVHRLTSSFGITAYQANDNPKTMIKRADQALYMAKNNGRNRVQTL